MVCLVSSQAIYRRWVGTDFLFSTARRHIDDWGEFAEPKHVVVAGISGLVGMFSEQALHKLHELADTTFGPAPSEDNAEKISITNVVFTSSTTINVMVHNASATDSSINSAFLNDVAITATNIAPTTPVTIAKSSSVTIKLTVSQMTSGTSYTIKLVTAKGTSVVNTTTYSP